MTGVAIHTAVSQNMEMNNMSLVSSFEPKRRLD